jgi:hypothetical protein
LFSFGHTRRSTGAVVQAGKPATVVSGYEILLHCGFFLRVGKWKQKARLRAATGPMKRILWHRAVSPLVAGIW